MPTYLEFAARGKTTWWRYPLAWILALLIAVLLGLVALIALELAHAVPVELATELRQPSHPLIYFAATGASFSAVLAGFISAIAIVHRKRIADVVGQWKWSMFWLGAGTWLVVSVVLTLIDVSIAPLGFRVTVSAATTPLVISALLALSIQTFAEEFVFRGYLTQGLLLALRRPFVAATVSGLAFGVVHLPNGVPQAAFATCFGAVTALIAIRTGGIAFSYGLHLVNNLFGAIVVVSAGDVFKGAPAVITQATPNLQWWDLSTGIAALVLVAWLVASRLRPDFSRSATE